MISKKNILDMVRHVSRKGQGYPDRKMLHPKREWMTGLAVTTVLFVASAAYIGFSFFTQLRSTDEGTPYDEAVVLYKQDNAREVLEEYRTRKATFEALRADQSNAAPPVVIEEEEETESAAEEGATSSEPLTEDAEGA